MPEISVCIVFYNAGKFIEKCACSLFEQTKADMQYIFVNDGSCDDSAEILRSVLRRYPHREPQTVMITHKVNLGVVASRRDAVLAATGDYIIHCDADDWVEPDIYEKLYSFVRKNNADMAYCSFFREAVDKKNTGILHETAFHSPSEMINAFFVGESHAALCNKLYLRHLEQAAVQECPSEITMCEDMRINIVMLLKCKKIVFCEDALYHYRENPYSLTQAGRDQKSIRSEISNIQYFDNILQDADNNKSLDIYKRCILLESCMMNAIPAEQWHSLWKKAKRGILSAKNITWKLKVIFICACINYRWTSRIWQANRQKKVKFI